MLRFFSVILKNIFNIIFMVPMMAHMAKHPEIYSEDTCYQYAKVIVGKIMKTGRIQTKCYGQDKLPKEGGYMLFPNHQGKFDALGIIYAHEKPCSVVMDEERSHMFIASQFIDLIKGKRLKKNDLRQAIGIIKELTDDTKNGKKYIIFPEGGYCNNFNTLGEFKPGCFKSAMKAKVPIVPVAIIDSYKAFEIMSIGKVVTQVHFLDPIPFAEYDGLTTIEVAQIVKDRINETIRNYVV